MIRPRASILAATLLWLSLIGCVAQASATVEITRVSGDDPWSGACGGFALGGYVRDNHTDNSVAAHPAQPGRAVAAWMQDDPLAVVSAFTSNYGKTWRQVTPPGMSRCDGGDDVNGDPRVALASNGTAYLSSLIGHYGGLNLFDSQILFSRARPKNGWSQPVEVTTKRGRYQHQTMLAVDPTNPRRVYIGWIEWSGTAGVYVATSSDGGRTFSAPKKVFDASARASFPLGGTITARADGSVLLAFELVPEGLILGSMADLDGAGLRRSFYVARSAARGRSWNEPVRVGSGPFFAAVDTVSPVPWLPAAGGSMSSEARGPLYVTWPTVAARGDAGSVEVARSLNGGRSWSTLPPARPFARGAVGAPAIDTTPTGGVAACWYEQSTDGFSSTNFVCASYSHRGRRWRRRPVLGPFDLGQAEIVLGRRSLGDYEGLTSIGRGFLATFNAPKPFSGDHPSVLFSAAFGKCCGRPVATQDRSPKH